MQLASLKAIFHITHFIFYYYTYLLSIMLGGTQGSNRAIPVLLVLNQLITFLLPLFTNVDLCILMYFVFAFRMMKDAVLATHWQNFLYFNKTSKKIFQSQNMNFHQWK